MKKVMIISISCIVGSWMFASSDNMDNYYNDLDEDYPILAAHQKMNNYGKDVMRKRAYRRKRMRRLPNNGK